MKPASSSSSSTLVAAPPHREAGRVEQLGAREPASLRRQRSGRRLVPIRPLEERREEVVELGAQQPVAREAQPVDGLRRRLSPLHLREGVGHAAQRHRQLDDLRPRQVDRAALQQRLHVGERERLDPHPTRHPVVEAPALVHHVLDHPRGGRAAEHHHEPRLPAAVGVPEVAEGLEEARLARRQPGHLVEQHHHLPPAPALPLADGALEQAEGLRPGRGPLGHRPPRGALEGDGEGLELQVPRRAVNAHQLEAELRAEELAHQEGLPDPAAAVDGDELTLGARRERLGQHGALGQPSRAASA
jgi:hypothetical protein